ncbi:hypothetical protein M885DRAFT_503030, partial [Pelagophyceae sp. CCMP2097]
MRAVQRVFACAGLGASDASRNSRGAPDEAGGEAARGGAAARWLSLGGCTLDKAPTSDRSDGARIDGVGSLHGGLAQAGSTGGSAASGLASAVLDAAGLQELLNAVALVVKDISELSALATKTLGDPNPDVLGFAAQAAEVAARVTGASGVTRLVEAARAAREAALLAPSEGAFERLPGRYSDATALARRYFQDPEHVVLLAFQNDALLQFEGGGDALLSTPCGSGKTAAPIVFAVGAWQAAHAARSSPPVAVYIAMTVLLVLDVVHRLNERFKDVFTGDFAVAISADEGVGDVMQADVIECVVVGTLMPVVLVMTPEMFVTKALVRAALVALLRDGRISIFLIDECDNPLVSASEQFRGSCRGLGLNLNALEAMAAKDARETRRSPPRVDLSGTVPRQLTADVAEDIGLRAPLLLVTSVDRANLRHVQVRLPRGAKFKARFKALCELVLGTDATVSVLIFAVSKKDVLKVAEQLAKVLRRVPHDG